MALPSFHSPPFLLANYSHFGNDLTLHPANGIYSIGGSGGNGSHSAVSQYFEIYNSKIINNITRTGFFADTDVGYFNNYFEFGYYPSNDYEAPTDFIRLHLQHYKQYVGPVSVSNPLHVRLTVQTGQLGIVYTYPTYYLTGSGPVPEAGVIIIVKHNEGTGQADVTVEWNDIVNSEWFSHTINNYPFAVGTSNFWKYHSRLNQESNPNYTAIEDFQLLTVQGGFDVPGIPSEEAFGDFTIEISPEQDIPMGGIPSEEAFGNILVSSGITHIVFTFGIPSAESFGVPRITRTTTIESAVGSAELPKEGDIRIILDPYIGHAEMLLADRDVEREPGLENAVLITLGSDREANQDDVLPDNSSDHGGWFGDELPLIETEKKDKIGTRLWLLQRAKTNTETVSRTKEYLKEGFQWMLDDSVISKLVVDAWIVENTRNTVGFALGLYRPNTESVYFKFYYNWENQKLRRV